MTEQQWVTWLTNESKSGRLERIMANPTHPIPAPYRPPPTPQKSWASLKPGDLMARVATTMLRPMVVTECDSQGCIMVDKVGDRLIHTIRLTDREWAKHWVKIPKTKRKSKKAQL